MVDESRIELRVPSYTRTQKRRNHSLHDFGIGHNVVSHFSCNVKKPKLEKCDIFVMKKLCEINALEDLDKTTITADEDNDDDVQIIGESFYFNINEDFPTDISKKSELEGGPDVEIIGEMYHFDGGSQISCANKFKKHKTDNLMESVKLGDDSEMKVVGHAIRSKQPQYRSFWKSKFGNNGQQFTSGVGYEHSGMSMESFSLIDGDKTNIIKEADASIKMTGVEEEQLYYSDLNLIKENVINNGHKKLKTLPNCFNKNVLKECNEKTKENSKYDLNDVSKAPFKKCDDFPFRENCQNIVRENSHSRLESTKNIRNKTLSRGTSNRLNNKCTAVITKEESIFSENNSDSSAKTYNHCDSNGETEKEYICNQFSSINEDSKALYSAMQHFTENNHDRAYRRLNATFPSSCALQPYVCYKSHQKPRKLSTSENMCEYHFGEGQWDEAIEVLEHIISKTTCPDWKLILYLLGHMCETDDIEYLNTCCEIISSLVLCHPPCYIPNYYLKIFTQTIEMQSLRNGGISKDGIFRDVMLNLQQFVKAKKLSEDYVCDSEESSPPTCNINSQLLVMELMVDILEENLSVWLPRRGFNPRTALLTDINCPLIVKLLWGSKQDGLERFNDTKVFKPIIDLYVSSFHKDVPRTFTLITSRLLALIAEVMCACDFEENATYPHFGQHSRKLAHAIYVSIADQSAFMIQKMIQGLSPSWLEMLVCCNCMSHFTTNSMTLQRLDFVTNCKKVVDHQTRCRSLARINAKGETRLHVLCRNKRLKELEELLSDPTVDVNVADHAGWTPLHEAVFKGNVDNLETLIMYRPPGSMGGVDLRAPGYAGKTPLMEAAEEGHIAVCKLLLKYGGATLLDDTEENGKTVWDLTVSANVRASLAQYADFFEGDDTSSRTKLSHTVVFKSAPTQEFWNLLSLFSYSYMDTFMLKNVLYHQHSGRSTSLENRDGKVQLTFDRDRLDADVGGLEEVIKFLVSLKFSS